MAAGTDDGNRLERGLALLAVLSVVANTTDTINTGHYFAVSG